MRTPKRIQKLVSPVQVKDLVPAKTKTGLCLILTKEEVEVAEMRREIFSRKGLNAEVIDAN